MGDGVKGSSRHRRGPLEVVIRGLADAFGVAPGVVIAAFVLLGLVFVPVLTLLVLLAILAVRYWRVVQDLARTRRQAGPWR